MSTNSTATKNARANAVTTEAGTGAKLQIWTAAFGTKLVEWTWTGNVWAAASAGSMAVNAPTTNPVNALATGTMAIGRLTKADGTTVVVDSYTVGTSGTEIVVANTSVTSGQPCLLVSFTSTEA